MIISYQEACAILGIHAGASIQEVKNAYKAQVKLYHPDAGSTADVQRYQSVVEAYEFLTAPYYVAGRDGGVTVNNQKPGHRIIGDTGKNNFYRTSNYESFEKQSKIIKKQKKEEFQEKVELYQEKKKEEETYQKAMDAIYAVLTAEAIKAMINESKRDE